MCEMGLKAFILKSFCFEGAEKLFLENTDSILGQ